jgi:L-fuculose-phosphate aldolase
MMQMIADRAAVEAARAHLAHIGRLMFDRHLTDAAGGNISVRVGDLVVLSPSLAGQQRQWQLEPDAALICDLDRVILEGAGKLSRESNVHFRLHRAFGAHGTAVIHAHPRNVMVFAAMARPMPVALEANLKFGEVQCVEYAPAHTTDLAENIHNALMGQESRIAKHAAGVIAPWHGVFLMGKDLNAAFDALERFDTNAYCLLMGGRALGDEAMAASGRALAEAAARFGKA